MSSTTRITQKTLTTLISAGIDLNEVYPNGFTVGVEETVTAKPVKVDGRNHEARKHNYEARIARRENTVMGGLTKKERSALYAANPALSTMSATKRAAEWKKIVKAYKAS